MDIYLAKQQEFFDLQVVRIPLCKSIKIKWAKLSHQSGKHVVTGRDRGSIYHARASNVLPAWLQVAPWVLSV